MTSEDGEPDDSDGTDGNGHDDVPLDITGHGDREPPGSANGDDASENGRAQENGDDASENGRAQENGDDASENGHGTDDADSGEDLITDFSVTDGSPGADGATNGRADGDDGPGDGGETVEPVELLVGMADDGEIDPWDIDIVAVTDEFLARLDESDLRTGGRALFYASVLLRMKSDAMLADDEPDEEWEEEPWDAPMGGEGPAPGHDPFDQLEAEMERRLERKRARGKPRTLDELVRELRERERETYWKERREYDTSDSPRGYARGTQTLDYRAADDLRMDDEPTEADVTGATHDEHIEDVINDVYLALQEQYDRGRDEVLFAEVADAGASRVQSFLALLFLAHRGQVRLQQDEFFGDLWVQDPAAVDTSDEAVAD